MFQKWGFLLTEIWVLLAIAAFLGLFVGWLVWGRRTAEVDTAEIDRLRRDLASCTAKGQDVSTRLAFAETRAKTAEARAEMGANDPAEAPTLPVIAAATTPQSPEPVLAAPMLAAKPAALDGPRNGKADDLKLIKGIGPKLEILCHRLGFYHFDQLANWFLALSL
jgi:predicted flap endonuclease-1-like 5' DNA nuclease